MFKLCVCVRVYVCMCVCMCVYMCVIMMVVSTTLQNLVEVKSVLGQPELLGKAYGLIAVSVGCESVWVSGGVMIG